MAFRQITVVVTVDEENNPQVTEALLTLIDSFVVKRMPVFESDIAHESNVDVPNAEEIRRDLGEDTPST